MRASYIMLVVTNMKGSLGEVSRVAISGMGDVDCFGAGACRSYCRFREVI